MLLSIFETTGGASAQIAYQMDAKETPAKKEKAGENRIPTSLFGIDYDVFTYSNLCSGNDGARRRYQYVLISKSNSDEVDDPCTHQGT